MVWLPAALRRGGMSAWVSATLCALGLLGPTMPPAACAQTTSGAASAIAPGAATSAQVQLREFLQGTRSARGAFTQRTAKAGGGSDNASGVFAFQRPGRLRWEVRKPYEQLLVSDGDRLWFFDRDLNQVTARKLADAAASSPAALLFGGEDLERQFELKEDGTRDGLAWVLALPKSRDAGFDRILIGLKGGAPEAMEVRDAFGRTTVFGFSAMERNPRLDAGLFRFVAPAGADLINQ